MRDYAELIEALRYCSINGSDAPCNKQCPYYAKRDGYECIWEMMRKTADAIEELLARDVVPTDFHERCLQLEIRKRFELEKQLPHWISVKDEPPKENDRYLVRYKRDVDLGDGETVHEDEIRIMRFFVDDGWRYPIICNDNVRLLNEEVTHWMPLPEPPKEVE